ncbi:MAG: hypothetical protein ACKPI9_08320, partial [Dolichospermum sp.]
MASFNDTSIYIYCLESIYGVQQTPPSALIISVSVICLLLYWVLFNYGRELPRNQENQSPENQ